MTTKQDTASCPYDWCDVPHGAAFPADAEWHRRKRTIERGVDALEFDLGVDNDGPFLYVHPWSEWEIRPDRLEDELSNMAVLLDRMGDEFRAFVATIEGQSR